MAEDRTLNELTELLRKTTASVENMVDQWGLEGEYMSLELINTIKKANKLLQILDDEKAIQES